MTLNAVFLKNGKVRCVSMSVKWEKKLMCRGPNKIIGLKMQAVRVFGVGGLPGNLVCRLRWFMDSTESQ